MAHITWDERGVRRVNGVPDDVAPDEWKEAVLDEVALCCMDFPIGAPPRSILKRVIEWHVQVALDPTVSSEAQALIDRGAAGVRVGVTSQALDELEQIVKDYDAISGGYTDEELAKAGREPWRLSPLRTIAVIRDALGVPGTYKPVTGESNG